MKIKLNSYSLKNLRPMRLLRYLPMLALIILLITFGLTINFLYEYFYQTIAQVKVVGILRNQVALNQINAPLYQKVLTAWESKKQFDETKLQGLNDPFRPLPAAPTTATKPSLEEANTLPYE